MGGDGEKTVISLFLFNNIKKIRRNWLREKKERETLLSTFTAQRYSSFYPEPLPNNKLYSL